MFKKGKIIFKKFKGDVYPTLDILDSEPSIAKELEEENYYTNKHIDNSTNFYRTKTQIAQPKSKMFSQEYADIERKNALKENQENKCYQQNNKTIQKKTILNNIPSIKNQNSPIQTKKIIKIQNILSNTNKNNMNKKVNSVYNTENQKNNESRIKNIPISFKKINLKNKRSLSRNSQNPRINTEPYIHKSPFQKRKSSFNTDINKNESINIHNNSYIISKIKQSPSRKGNLIPKPNNNVIKAKKNIMFGNNKIENNIIYQKKENKMKEEKHEIDYLRETNEFFHQIGLTLEERIDFEYNTIKIQANYRGYITRKKLYSLINNCIKIKNGINLIQKIISGKIKTILNMIKKFNKNYNSNNLRSKQVSNQLYLQNKLKAIENNFKDTNIDKVNCIVINIPSKYKKIKDFEELRIKKLRDLVRKKIYKTKEIKHRVFIKFYYSALYIHLNWYIYAINQLSYTQNLGQTSTFNGNYNNNSYTNKIVVNSNKSEEDLFSKKHSSEANNVLGQSISTINKINENEKPDDALRESIMSINKINDELSKEAIEKEKEEKKKHLKGIVTKRLKELKNEMSKAFTKFYYQGLLIQKEKEKQESKKSIEVCNIDDNNIQINNESGPTKLRGKKKENLAADRRNKARNLRKLMMKKEKEKNEKLKLYFYKFHTNGMLFQLKKNTKKSYSCKNIVVNLDNNENEIKEKEITLLDKKLMEKELEKQKLKQQRISALQNIFYKTDRQYTIIKKKTIEKWNLRAKILSLAKISKNDLKRSERKKKRLKKNCRSKTAKIEDHEIKNEE